jgi:hypothetical protein
MIFHFWFRFVELGVLIAIFFIVWIARYIRMSREDRERLMRRRGSGHLRNQPPSSES